MTKTPVLKWEDWPHIYKMEQFSGQDLLVITQHSVAFAKAMMEDRILPRRSNIKRQNRDGQKVRRLVRSVFYQPSSRTEGTFDSAVKLLKCRMHSVKDPAHLSSAAKGESFKMATMAYTICGRMKALRQCDYLIIRHKQEKWPEEARGVVNSAQRANQEPVLPLPIINAGDGSEGQHPTQALVDLATMYLMKEQSGTLTEPEKFLDGTVLLLPGELHRSRVINSLLYACGRFADKNKIKILFCCPEGGMPKSELIQNICGRGVECEFHPEEAFRDLIPGATTVYMTRPQSEYDGTGNGPTHPIDRYAVQFRAHDLRRLQPGAYVMHPLPINENPDDPPPEIDPILNALAITGDPRCVWGQQSHMGLPVRAALLDLLFHGMDEEAHRIYGLT